MLFKIFGDCLSLFYPSLCSSCDQNLTYNETVVCTNCLHYLPYTNFTNKKNNAVEKSFYGRIPIHAATSLFYFRKEGTIQKIIHQLKYKNQQHLGTFMGELLGQELKNSARFSKIDFVIPVPIHSKKLKKRGYNQLTYFGKKVAEILNTSFCDTNLVKYEKTNTQTHKSRLDRWENSKLSFSLKDLKKYENCHILLIDDVITTGATLEACCNELLKTNPILISIATIGYTE